MKVDMKPTAPLVRTVIRTGAMHFNCKEYSLIKEE